MDYSSVVTSLVSALLGGGIFQAIRALRTSKPEASKLIVDAATDVVIVQKGLLDRQAQEIKNLEARVDELDKISDEMRKMHAEIRKLQQENEELRSQLIAAVADNEKLKNRIRALEAPLKGLGET